MTILALADIISRQAEILEESRGSSSSSSSSATTGGDPTAAADPYLSAARSTLLEACDKLNHLVQGPEEYMLGLAQGHRVHAALQYVTAFGIAARVPADGLPIAYAELARRAGLRGEGAGRRLTRVLRLLMTYHVFREPAAGCVAHNRNSRVLLEDADAAAAVAWYAHEALGSSAFLAAASRRWPGSQEPHQTALTLAYATDLPAFGFLTQRGLAPERADRYGRAMAGLGRRRQLSAQHLVAGYDWGRLAVGSTVVDVGGGADGHCARALADAFPALRFVVQDIEAAAPEDEGEGEEQVDGGSSSSSSRLRFMRYDFFTPQPVAGADVYLLRRVLHHHPDKYAVRILCAQMAALRAKPGARLVIMDDVAIRSGMLTTLEERKSRILDISMMSLYNSAERDLDDWKVLFREVDPELKLINVTKPPGSSLSIMELGLESG
ncbi:S-adenosyl-L-methionine-dependent methyltransferase [Xylariomycetidae sp. FL0641]|nr:S-adenosyl-L-methionine-dependent methyltransferase [Xylariomycetidae sp. FL0641]